MFIKRFFESSIYDLDWHDLLPSEIRIIKYGQNISYSLGNVMKNSDMIQVVYSTDKWGIPSDLEFDFYFLRFNGKIKLDIDITVGDSMVSEFSIVQPNNVDIIHYTSKGSKFNPNEIFALTDESLIDFCDFLSKIEGFQLKSEDLYFLNKNYKIA